MFVLVENDSITKTLNSSRGITIGENQYPRAIYTLWSTAEREAIGIYEVVFDNSNKRDAVYYNNTGQSFDFSDGVATASYGSPTAKSLADVTDEDDNVTLGLKSQRKEIIKQQASELLTPTDWYVIKATDVESYSVPSAITTYRANVRTKSNDMEVLIDACSTVDELADLHVYNDNIPPIRPLGEFPTLDI
jgi:hypothetical protein